MHERGMRARLPDTRRDSRDARRRSDNGKIKMDEVARYNQARWKALVEADALFTRPRLNLDVDSARQMVDSAGRLGDVSGKKVLCLASGGGQQSAAFALLGADVTVFDISAEQLERDREAAAHYGFEIETV